MVTEQAARHPSVGSGPIPWLLLCWRGPSCPPYLKEQVVGEQAEEVRMSVADCSQEGRELLWANVFGDSLKQLL